jgi:Drosophila Retinin like protein
MFKLVVLSCLVSVAFAGHLAHPVASYAQLKTVVEPAYSVVETPTVNHVATVVKSIPSAHSYQSQTQYHSKSVVEPIYAHGVEKKIISTPIVKQIVEPAVKYVETPIAHYAAPAVKYVQAPVAYAAPAYSAYAAPAVKYVSAPAAYAAPAHYAAAPAHYASAYSAYPSAYSAYPAYSPYSHHY